MPPEDQINGNTPRPGGDPAVAQTAEFVKPTAGLASVSGLFGLNGQTADTAKPASPTSGFTSSGLAPTALYVPLPDDATPRTLQGRYRLIAELGMGGMGVTYRAWDSQDGVPVVIKMPRKDVRANPEIMDRFNREVRTMLELSHEHIVPIVDHGEEEGCPFVAMRFLPGGSLSEYRGKDEAGKAARLSPATLHFWLPGIARALDFMHASGVLHRDVKPGNIFLDGFLKPFLGDFGIAKVVDDSGGLNREYTLTATRMAVGTPEYMAPELFRPATTPDGRVDQYALAVTVYEMLAGRKPFRGDSAHIIVEHASKEVPPLEEFCPDAPASLVEAVHKALAKSPNDRFATCSEFAAAVLVEVPKLNLDTSRARLLCPSCRAILRVAESTAGKRGTCPKCKSPMAVAQDLGSLWLAGEDRSTVSVVPEIDSEFATEESFDGKAAPSGMAHLQSRIETVNQPQPAAIHQSGLSLLAKSLVFTGACLVFLAAGYFWGRTGREALVAEMQLRKGASAESKAYDATASARVEKIKEPLEGERGAAAPLKVLTNSIGIQLKLLPAGTFTMGPAYSSGNHPHQVTLTKPFYMGVYEVTNRQWERAMGSVPSRWKDADRPVAWKDADRPVALVSFDDANEFCGRLSALPDEKQAGRVYRLPTEAEWEYACRAGTTTEYCFGDAESSLSDYGWFVGNSGNQIHPVGQKRPNAWGLYDMHGNVWEWCSDWYGVHGKNAVTDPQGPSGASFRVGRGGSWLSTANRCRSAYRNGYVPSNRYDDLGFRLALSPSGEEPQPEAAAGK